MKIKALFQKPSAKQIEQLGTYFNPKNAFDIELGKEYIVIGMFWGFQESTLGKDIWVMYRVHSERIGFAPLCLFEVIDDRVSKYWKYYFGYEHHYLQPQELIDNPHFNELLTDGEPEIVKIFADLYKRLETEFETEKVENEEFEF